MARLIQHVIYNYMGDPVAYIWAEARKAPVRPTLEEPHGPVRRAATVAPPSGRPESARPARLRPPARRGLTASERRARLQQRAQDDLDAERAATDDLLARLHARAVAQGFPGDAEALRPHLTGLIEHARSSLDDLHAEDAVTGDLAILRQIAKAGGLARPQRGDNYSDVARAFWELSDGVRDMGSTRSGRSRAVRYLREGAVMGVKGVVRWNGKSPDQILEAIAENPQWEDWTDVTKLEEFQNRLQVRQARGHLRLFDFDELDMTVIAMANDTWWWDGPACGSRGASETWSGRA